MDATGNFLPPLPHRYERSCPQDLAGPGTLIAMQEDMGSNLYIAASGAAARLQQLEIVANNLANAESIGFKADRAVF